MAQQGSVSPWLGVWGANIVSLAVGMIFLRRIEKVRKPNRFLAWVDSLFRRHRPAQRLESEAAPIPIPITNGKTVKANGGEPKPSVADQRAVVPEGDTVSFPMLIRVVHEGPVRSVALVHSMGHAFDPVGHGQIAAAITWALRQNESLVALEPPPADAETRAQLQRQGP
jgi:hypothetical protein